MAITHEELKQMLVMSRPAVSDEFALETVDMFPKWEDIIGVALTQDDVDKGYDRYQYNGKLYQLIQPHTPESNWTPDTMKALWKEVSLEEWPEWIQPTGSEDSYKKDAKVTHNGKKWVSTTDNNVWEPGVYGWDEVTE